jgi:site-specific DNA recombinase
MTGEYKKYRYYVCHNFRRKVLDIECPVRSIRADKVEDAVWKEVKRLLKNPALIQKALKQSRLQPDDTSINDLKSLLEEKEKEEERLLDIYLAGKFDIAVLNQRIEKIRKVKEVIQKDIATLKEKLKIDTQITAIQELRLTPSDKIDSYPYEKKREALRLLFWGQEGIGVFLKPDHSIELRGLIRSPKNKLIGIEYTSILRCEHNTTFEVTID